MPPKCIATKTFSLCKPQKYFHFANHKNFKLSILDHLWQPHLFRGATKVLMLWK